jgi:hypothetical protein
MNKAAEYLDLFKQVMPQSRPKLSPERMTELGMQHELFEFNTDIDGLMNTLVDEPVYELHPRGATIKGRAAVRLFYERTLHIYQQWDQRKGQQTRKILSIAYGDCHMAVEVEDDFEFPNGARKRVQFMVAVEYRQDGKMYGERLYADQELAAVIDGALGADFFDRPDVTVR